MTVVVAIHDVAEATACIAHAMSCGHGSPAEVTIIGVSRLPRLWWCAGLSGCVSVGRVELDAVDIASSVARTAMALLPESVAAGYLVCWWWRHPSLRDYLIGAGCDELIVARRRWRTNALLAKLALRGTGIRVRLAAAPA